LELTELPLEEIVTLIVALEEGRVVRNISNATGLIFRSPAIALVFVLTLKLKEHLRDEVI
jgi:hypothetical protein